MLIVVVVEGTVRPESSVARLKARLAPNVHCEVRSYDAPRPTVLTLPLSSK